MIDLAAYALGLLLAQEPEAPPAAEPAGAPAGEETRAAPAPAPAGAARPRGADEVSRLIQKIPTMNEVDRAAALEALVRQYGVVESNPVLPGLDTDLEQYLALEPKAQVEVVARGFLTELIGGDPSRLVARAGFPFFLEGRRVDRPDELKSEWGKSLRSRRTELLQLYGVEVLSPADMEKKYGKPPQRLSAWGWRAPNTFVAVANVSGHATVLLLRQAGAAWQVVGFHD